MQRVKSRWSAFSIHLGISLVIFIALASVIFLSWFPGGLFTISGGWDGIQIVALVDLVLGPLLTLIVYNASKPLAELVRDLSIIATIQCVCLGAGVFLVYESRPVLVAHVYDTFYSYKLADVVDDGIDIELLDGFQGDYPKVIYVDVPQEPADFVTLHLMTTMNNQTPLPKRVDLYKDFPQESEAIRALLHNVEEDSEQGCLRMLIKSAYHEGSICFDPERFSFTHFEPPQVPAT